MTQYHVTDDGKVAVCRATVKKCMYLSRDDERHFESKDEAEAQVARKFSETYSTFKSMKRRVTDRKNSGAALSDLSLDIGELSLVSNNTPKVQPLPSGIAYSDFERVLEQIAGDTNWYYETA